MNSKETVSEQASSLPARAVSVLGRMSRGVLLTDYVDKIDPLQFAVVMENLPGIRTLDLEEKNQVRSIFSEESTLLWDPDWDKSFLMEVVLTDISRSLLANYDLYVPVYILRRVLGEKSILMANIYQGRGKGGSHLVVQALYHWLSTPIEEKKERLPGKYYDNALTERIDIYGRNYSVDLDHIAASKAGLFDPLTSDGQFVPDFDVLVDWPYRSYCQQFMGLTLLEMHAMSYDVKQLLNALREGCSVSMVDRRDPDPVKARGLFNVLVEDGLVAAITRINIIRACDKEVIEPVFVRMKSRIDAVLSSLERWVYQ